VLRLVSGSIFVRCPRRTTQAGTHQGERRKKNEKGNEVGATWAHPRGLGGGGLTKKSRLGKQENKACGESGDKKLKAIPRRVWKDYEGLTIKYDSERAGCGI